MPFTDYQNGIQAYDGTPTGDAGLALNKDLKTIAQHIEIVEEALFRYAGLTLKDRIYRGVWAVGTAYVLNDVVRHKNGVYIAGSSTTGADPTAGSPWTLISNIGLDNTGSETSGDNTLRTSVTFGPTTPAVVTLDSSVSLGTITFNTGTDRQEVLVWLKGSLSNEPTYSNGTASGDVKDFTLSNNQTAKWRFSSATSYWHLIQENPFNQSLNTGENATFANVSATGGNFSYVNATNFNGGSFTGDGSALTNLPNIFNQSLNTSDCPTFSCVNAAYFNGGVFTGDGSALTGIPNPFNQSLNVGDCPSFTCVSAPFFYYATDMTVSPGLGYDFSVGNVATSVPGMSFRTGRVTNSNAWTTFNYFTIATASTQTVEILWNSYDVTLNYSVAGRRLYQVKCDATTAVTANSLEDSRGGDEIGQYGVFVSPGSSNQFYVYGLNGYGQTVNWSYTTIRNRYS